MLELAVCLLTSVLVGTKFMEHQASMDIMVRGLGCCIAMPDLLTSAFVAGGRFGRGRFGGRFGGRDGRGRRGRLEGQNIVYAQRTGEEQQPLTDIAMADTNAPAAPPAPASAPTPAPAPAPAAPTPLPAPANPNLTELPTTRIPSSNPSADIMKLGKPAALTAVPMTAMNTDATTTNTNMAQPVRLTFLPILIVCRRSHSLGVVVLTSVG